MFSVQRNGIRFDSDAISVLFDINYWEGKSSAPIKGSHQSKLVMKHPGGQQESNMFIEEIGRPSLPISWILKEINDKVRLRNNDGKFESPNLLELNYASEISEMALEYVD